MSHRRTLNNRINHIYHRALRIVYKGKQSSFEELLQKDNSVSVHMKNLHYLVTEIFKVKNDLSLIIMKEVFNFQENESYNLRSCIHLAGRNTHIADFRTDIIGPELWKLITDKTKHDSTLSAFKAKIKSWTISSCPCRLCKYLLRILVLLKFVQVSSGIHTNAYCFFFLKKVKKSLQ